MKCLVFILNEVEKLNDLLHALQDKGIRGATIIHSTGMAKTLYSSNQEAVFGALRQLLNANREENRTLFVVLPEDKVATAIAVIESVVGDLNQPNRGIAFTLDIGDLKGEITFKDTIFEREN
ncbi:MAG: hypothetical protein GX777_01545 [Fastidiosipila sp.]|nr:hypothetical protein [Fastidiosipila sp.]